MQIAFERFPRTKVRLRKVSRSDESLINLVMDVSSRDEIDSERRAKALTSFIVEEPEKTVAESVSETEWGDSQRYVGIRRGPLPISSDDTSSPINVESSSRLT